MENKMCYYIIKIYQGTKIKVGRIHDTKKRAEAEKRFLQFFDKDLGAKYEIKKKKRKVIILS